jgi:hypothetical protein
VSLNVKRWSVRQTSSFDLASVSRELLQNFAAGARYLPWIIGVDDLQGFRQPFLIGEYEEGVMSVESGAPRGDKGMFVSADHHNHDFFGKSQPDDLLSHRRGRWRDGNLSQSGFDAIRF